MEDEIVIKIQVKAVDRKISLFNFMIPSIQLAIVGVGVLVESEAMQWMGFAFFCLLAFALSKDFTDRAYGEHLSIDEARAKLDKLEAKLAEI